MHHSTTLVAAAVASLIALGTAQAADTKPYATEKCAGIVKAGANDCGTSWGGCHGSATVDGNDEAWIEVPKGTCARIVGAHVTTSPYAIPGGKEAYEEAQRKSAK